MNVEYRSARKGVDQRLDEGEKKDKRLAKPPTPLGACGFCVPGIAVEGRDKANANVAWKMSTD